MVSLVNMSVAGRKNAFTHSHDSWEIVLNLQGRGTTLIGNREYLFEPGTIICYPPMIPHGKTSLSDEGFRDIFLMSSIFPLSKIADENSVIVSQDDSAKSFEALMHIAFRTFCLDSAKQRSLLSALYETMNQLLLSWMDPVPKDPEVERVKDKILNSFSDPEFSLSELDTSYCRDHLRRRFKKATGTTPSHYLTALRMEHAKKLMAQNHQLQYSIAEIGVMSGYYDSRYFSRVFKKNTEMTPQEYAKHLLGQA